MAFTDSGLQTEYKGDKRMKKGVNYGIAALVFVLTMALMNGSGILLSVGTALFGTMIGGVSGINSVYEFLMNNLNLYSCLIYVITGTVFLLWYYFAVIEPRGVNKFVNAQTKKLSPSSFVWLFILSFAAEHVISLLMALINVITPSAMEEYSELVETSGLSEYSPVWAIATIILPPLVEETIFRGLILRYLRKAGACFIVANLIQAVLFGVYHMNLVQGIYAAVLGLLLGYLVWRYESLIAPMMVHALFNFFGTVIAEVESNILPEFFLGALIIGCVPLLVLAFVMIHWGIGEKKREGRK